MVSVHYMTRLDGSGCGLSSTVPGTTLVMQELAIIYKIVYHSDAHDLGFADNYKEKLNI